MKKILITIALIGAVFTAYSQNSLWTYDAVTPVATDTMLIWHQDSTKVVTWSTMITALQGQTYDTTSLYAKLQNMSDSTNTNSDSINIAMDSLRVHISRILAVEAEAGLNTDSVNIHGDTLRIHIARILALEAGGGGFTEEQITDFVGGMFTGNTETGISATFQDADNTIDLVVSAAGGDVSKVNTPVDNQVGVWTGDGTIEGTSGLTYDGSNVQLTGDIGSTGTPITKGWFTDLQVTNAIAGSVTGNAATVTSFTPASGSLTLAGADAITLTSTAGTSLTLPTTGVLATTQDINDSIDALLAAGEPVLAIADTAAMLAPYVNIADDSGSIYITPYLLDGAVAASVAVADSSGVAAGS